MGKLDGRIAIVTGASRGIGEEIARLFAREGARVACAARTLNEGDHRLLSGSLSGTVGKIRQAGGQAIAVAADVSREEDCQRLVRTAQDTFGTVDILVNDAALTYYKPIDDNVKHWVKAFAVNVHGPFMLSQHLGFGTGHHVTAGSTALRALTFSPRPRGSWLRPSRQSSWSARWCCPR